MTDPQPPVELEVLLPVYNEADSIAATLREIYTVVSALASMRFIICEDGSRDGTRQILIRLSSEIPVKLILSDARKGYSRAVREGMEAATAPYVLCLDSDGQCDPHDFLPFWKVRNDADVVIGRRVHRADPLLRWAASRFFYFFYQLLYRVPVHDPSCPFVLARREVVQRVGPHVVEMQQGFWWEFVARAHRRGLSIIELPIKHRIRAGGSTQIYKLSKMPGIGYRHFRALLKIWLEPKGS
ncbi:MAG: glycosyltransferase family 2 protein [Thermoguttaceae bacterium]